MNCSLNPFWKNLKPKPATLSTAKNPDLRSLARFRTAKAVLRAIINEPKILLADEPTGNLDTKNSEVVLEMLRRLNKDLGQTIVMITHNPEATVDFDRVVHMRDGIIVDGIPAD